jgi:hypothetical protein
MSDILQNNLSSIPNPVVSTYTSAAIVNDGRALWKLKIIVAGAVSGTNPTLSPQMSSANADGTSFSVMHPLHQSITASGTYWFSFAHLDVSDSPVNDKFLKILLVTGGSNPSFGGVSAVLYGIK